MGLKKKGVISIFYSILSKLGAVIWNFSKNVDGNTGKKRFGKIFVIMEVYASRYKFIVIINWSS